MQVTKEVDNLLLLGLLVNLDFFYLDEDHLLGGVIELIKQRKFVWLAGLRLEFLDFP